VQSQVYIADTLKPQILWASCPWCIQLLLLWTLHGCCR
jgi:hypothetical protein